MYDNKNIQQAIGMLKQQFGERLTTSKAVRHQHGQTNTRISNQPPDAVIFVKNTDEVSTILRV